MFQHSEDILFFIAGLVLVSGLFVWPIVWMGLRSGRRMREMEHLERIKAIEFGYILPQDKASNPALAIGVGVPSAAFAMALVATFVNAGVYAWPAAGAVGVAAVICGSILAVRQPVGMPVRGDHPSVTNGKPVMDPDAIDVTGRRG